MKRFWIGISLLALTLSLSTGCSTNPVTNEREFRLISYQEERQIGAEAAPEFEKEFGGLVDDPTLQSYVDRVGANVARFSEQQAFDYEFGLLASDTPNAFALPGGFVYITAGLFEQMENEAQLAAVLGHEVAHVAYGHSVDQMEKAMGAQVLLAIVSDVAGGGGAGQAAAAGAEVAAAMAMLNYSRSDEYEADQRGMVYMTKAGYNPWGMVGLLNTLLELSGGEEGGDFSEMFRTHPLTTNRIDRVEETIEDDYVTWSAGDKTRLYSEEFLRMRARLR